jgi:hypothetical protein
MAMMSTAMIPLAAARTVIASIAALGCAWPAMATAAERAPGPVEIGRPLARAPVDLGAGLVSCGAGAAERPSRPGARPGARSDRSANPTAWPDTRQALAPICLGRDHGPSVPPVGNARAGPEVQLSTNTPVAAGVPASDGPARGRDGRSLHEPVGNDFTIGHRVARQTHLDWWFWADPDQGASDRQGLGGAVDSAQTSARSLTNQTAALADGMFGWGGQSEDQVNPLPMAIKLSLRFTWPPHAD